MQNKNIVAIRRGKMFYQYSIAFLIMIGGVFLLIYFNILSLQVVQDSFLLMWFLVVFGIPYLFAFLKYLDKKPMLMLNEKGVAIRKSRLPFFSLELISWSDIAHYEAKVNQFRYGETMYLTITAKSTKKKYFVDLLDLNVESDDVMALLNQKMQTSK